MKDSHRSAILFLLPSFVMVAAFAILPIIDSFRVSFYRLILTLPWLGQKSVGWENYLDLWRDPVARDSLRTTMLFAGVTIPLELLLGLGMALVLNESFRGRGLLRAVVLVPWAIPTVVSAQMWRFIFNDQYGLVNFALFGADTTRYFAPLADPHFALIAIMAAEIWKTTPFTALILLAGLQGISDDLYEAATVDGATQWQKFWQLTLPLLRPALLLALLFRTIDALRVFDLVFVMTQGGPADSTNVLQFYGYKKSFAEGMIGYGSAIAVTVFLLAVMLSMAYLRLLKVNQRGPGSAMKRPASLAIFSCAIALYCLVPFLWFVLTSLKSPADVAAIPPKLITSWHWGFYQSALAQYHLLNYLVNSVIIALPTMLITVAFGALAAYAISRFQLRWTELFLLAMLAVSMFPQIAIAGPIWALLNRLGWLNSYAGLITVYVALNLPLAIWILTTFFRDVPAEVEEAALVDGCSRFQALFKIVLPIAAPGIFTSALLVFTAAWNEFFFALIIMTDPAMQTLPVGIALFPGEYTMPWGEIAAASTVATIPLVLLTLIFQRGIVRGLSAGAVKG